MASGKLRVAKLTPEFDVDRLLAELDHLEQNQWAAQRTYGESLTPGTDTVLDWKVLALRSPEGRQDRTDPGGPGLVGPSADRANRCC